ncbi:hypothetical protein DO021_00880 [Desulfobacter hydrogenophilus]|uniref:DUF2339 domain-containing protein n=1 Tax=Desulfobacter hydrogenophilus TaxID=2291 RepID=A0A328FHF5_9BACT|nr:DUF2339 domain-containing protein [Desulfobacter hydrogenophilus]NDY72797.1 DUF2339 domain-containing protein [Desulfobacter hydrogenophilus]QBH13024.1 DUF2339 domain-containing protein [Desulfobacter hydrogenophilus]RAM04008.1 hypothetical protein DO021_00880 [Desulfobacter hydrogenophilus]
MYFLFLFLVVVTVGVQLSNLKQSNRELEKKLRGLEDKFDRLNNTVQTLKAEKSTASRDTAAPDDTTVELTVETKETIVPPGGASDISEPWPRPDYDFSPVQGGIKTDPLPSKAQSVKQPSAKPDKKAVPYIPPAALKAPESNRSVSKYPGVSLGQRISRLNINWELFTGARLFAWVGGVAAFICIGLLFKHSIEKNWIPPAARLAFGALLGAGLILASEKFKEVRLKIFRHSLTATGIGVLYIVIFTATLYYDYLPVMAGFAMLALVSAAAFVLAVYQKGLTVSVLGAIGAYVTPLMINTGSGNLTGLFIYLAVVNIALYLVSEKLNSTALLLTGTTGTLVTLGLAVLNLFTQTSGSTIAGIWAANLILFTVFLRHQGLNPVERKPVFWSGCVLYLSSVAMVLLLTMEKPGWHPLMLLTIAMICAIVLATKNKGWIKAFIPFSCITFIAAVIWVVTRFDATDFSFSYVLILVYGAAGCLGPVALVMKFGKTGPVLQWFKVFPVALALMCLTGLILNPMCAFYFWPMMLGIQMLGLFVSLIFRAVIQVFLLLAIFVVGAIFWMIHIPADAMGAAFFIFILGAGSILLAGILVMAVQLPRILAAIKMAPRETSGAMIPEKWLSAAPVAGVFILIGFSFFVSHPHFPHMGMATLACFLIIAVFFARRTQFQPVAVVALMGAAAAQATWVLNTSQPETVILAGVWWSGSLFVAALVAPWQFFKQIEHWKHLWNIWAVYEVLQAIFFFYSVKHAFYTPWADWCPMLMIAAKLWPVARLLRQLPEKAHRNSILAFHGGALLFYVSVLPVLVLSHGWIGLALVLEATALLWLNTRIVHPGLPKTAVIMAPAGLLWLLISLPQLKGLENLPVLNPAIFALALAVAALGAGVRFAKGGDQKVWRMDAPDFFRWLSIGSGFYLMNLIIADIFAGPDQKFRVMPGADFIQAAVYCLSWAGAGAMLWRMARFPIAMRLSGLGLLAAGACWLLSLPFLLGSSVAQMAPFSNLGLLAFILLSVILYFSCSVNAGATFDDVAKKVILAGFITALFMAFQLASGTIFQAGQAFTLFFAFTLNQEIVSTLGFAGFGLGLLLWKKGLDTPFRMAGLVLITVALVRSLGFPFRFGRQFTAMMPLVNVPTLMYAILLALLVFVLYKNPKQRWPVSRVSARQFMGVALAATAFAVMNIEIAACLGHPGETFSLLASGNYMKLLAYSIGWMVFAIALLVTGIRFSLPLCRWVATGLICITVVKVFIADTAKLDMGYKIASFSILSLGLFFVAYLYQKFISDEPQKRKQNNSQ